MIVLIMFVLKTTFDRKKIGRGLIEKYFITSTFYKQTSLNLE